MKKKYAIPPLRPRLIPAPADLALLGAEDCDFLLDVMQGKRNPIQDPDWQRFHGILVKILVLDEKQLGELCRRLQSEAETKR